MDQLMGHIYEYSGSILNQWSTDIELRVGEEEGNLKFLWKTKISVRKLQYNGNNPREDYSLEESCFVLAFIVVSELDVTLDPGQLYGLLLSDGVGPVHNGVPGL